MKVSFVKKKERSSIWTILCDDQPWREVHGSIVGRHPIWSQKCETLDQLDAQFSAFEYQKAKLYAVKRLSLQAMLSTALVRSLKERLVSETTIHRIIEEFLNEGLLDDESWAQSFVRTQTARKVGPRAITQKLARKGLKREELQEVVQDAWESEDQKALVMQLLKSRYVRRNLSDYAERQKVVASLIRRGFDLSVILDCL